jgi:hypothetical protein
MPIQTTIFAQLMTLIDHKQLNRCIEQYQGNALLRTFLCLDQFLCMAFAQLGKKKSLSATIFTLSRMEPKLYHMGIRGILNLKRCGVKVEIRVVIHQQTYERLPQLAEFITRNLLFVDQVVLMGLEMTGFTKANFDALWVDPAVYQPQLVEAVETLTRFKMKVSVYNHQLCVLDKRLWPYNVQSISDWKNEYMPECEPCIQKDKCGGFFSSATLRYSDHIQPFSNHAESIKA